MAGPPPQPGTREEDWDQDVDIILGILFKWVEGDFPSLSAARAPSPSQQTWQEPVTWQEPGAGLGNTSSQIHPTPLGQLRADRRSFHTAIAIVNGRDED